MKLYAYAACLICLMTGAIFLGQGMWGILRIHYPEMTVRSHEWNSVATLERFTQRERRKTSATLSDEEIAKRWQDERDAVIKEEKREGVRNIFRMIICMVIVVPLFAIHWGLAGRMRLAGGGK